VRSGEADVVLGARSAVFAPVQNLGLIVVDEEHESSYKQDSSPRYDARQVAYRRARGEGALVVYGTATPRPETWKALPRASLTVRADGATLPAVEIVDMRMQAPGPVSRPLQTAIQAAVDRGEKAIVLLNRRGLARLALCRSCGWIGRCPDCDVPLVIHHRPEQLVCHHCGLTRALPSRCPECGAAEVGRQGTGTQGLAEALGTVVPDVPIIRLDADVTRTRGELVRRLDRFARPGPAVLIGTQIVAKGHDLPAITVAGVLDADGPLQQPDFRAEERAFALIVQLAGRAGRRGEPATVYVQAWEPGSRAILLAARHAVPEFLAGELERRQVRGFPPFGHLVQVIVDGENESTVAVEAGKLAATLRDIDARLTVFGPARLHRLRGRHRRTVLVRADSALLATATVTGVLAPDAARRRRAGIRTVVDVDPQET
jgi:primosomal protein N' (replication factor Y)